MFDMLGMLNEATKEANAFENHAAAILPLEERLLYLNGLSIVMNADGEIHEEEKEYLRILIKSFDMDDSLLASFVEFAQSPDKDTIQQFFRTFRRRPIAHLFLFDALMMTRRDELVTESEQLVLDKMVEELEVLKGTYSDIYDLFCHIKNKNWDQSALYFSSHLLNPEYFKHLLDYFEVNFDDLMKNTSERQIERLSLILKNRNQSEENGILNEVLFPFFQKLIDTNQLEIVLGRMMVNSIEVAELSSIGLGYNPDEKALYLAEIKVVDNQEVYQLLADFMGLSLVELSELLLIETSSENKQFTEITKQVSVMSYDEVIAKLEKLDENEELEDVIDEIEDDISEMLEAPIEEFRLSLSDISDDELFEGAEATHEGINRVSSMMPLIVMQKSLERQKTILEMNKITSRFHEMSNILKAELSSRKIIQRVESNKCAN